MLYQQNEDLQITTCEILSIYAIQTSYPVRVITVIKRTQSNQCRFMSQLYLSITLITKLFYAAVYEPDTPCPCKT